MFQGVPTPANAVLPATSPEAPAVSTLQYTTIALPLVLFKLTLPLFIQSQTQFCQNISILLPVHSDILIKFY